MSSELMSVRSFVAVADSALPDMPATREALDDVLRSKHFHGSKQCSDLLRYIVEHSLSSDDGPLKERVIGIQVFGRAPDYDTADDPVVRVRAADVRKRLAQYYQGCESASVPLRLELHPGSYRVCFRQKPVLEHTPLLDAAVPNPPSAREDSGVAPGKVVRVWLACILLLALSAGLLFWVLREPKSDQSLFFAPLTTPEQPVLVYLGSNPAFVFTPEYLAHYRAARGNAYNGPEFMVDLPPNGSIRVSDLVPVSNTFITGGDLAAAVQMASLFDGLKKTFVLRSGRDVVVGDLRGRPSVLIGGFNNPWTLEVTSDLPYNFQQGTRIEEKSQPHRSWSVNTRPGGNNGDDYGLISRLMQSKTGGPIVIVAGIGSFGTQAAAEFLSSPDRMKELLKSAPRGWEKKNMQAVLHIKVVDYAPVAVDVVAASYW